MKCDKLYWRKRTITRSHSWDNWTGTRYAYGRTYNDLGIEVHEGCLVFNISLLLQLSINEEVDDDDKSSSNNDNNNAQATSAIEINLQVFDQVIKCVSITENDNIIIFVGIVARRYI